MARNSQASRPNNHRPAAQLDRSRYLRLMFFFGRLFGDVVLWELVFRAVFGTQFVARGRTNRLRRYARQFRQLAVAMGGVMIKLGQFISSRVDVIPPAITDELSGLQDEVPPEDLDDMLRVIEAELGAPPASLFAEFDADVQAAASLGQVYRARLMCGDRVAIKVQRPGIENLIATDLQALRVVARWAMLWNVIRRRADVPALLNEFARTLWEEVDYEAEADNAERFQELFANDVRVYIPAIYREYSTRRVLTMEDVTAIKIMDTAAIDAAGVNRAVAARRLLDMYLRMIFEFGFFHADPHPGNLFIYPLPNHAAEEMDIEMPPGDGRPFYIVFVDFGMVGRITERVKAGLREALIAVATRDARRVLKAYQMLGILLPSADLDRIEQAEAEVLDYIWGKSVTELAQMPRGEMQDFAMRYRDLLYEMPFQVPQDFIYLGRAVGILSGICTLLDPSFNPWEPVARYAQKLVEQEAQLNLDEWINEAISLGRTALSLPNQMADVLGRLQRGDVSVRVAPDPSLESELRRLEASVTGLTRAVIFGSLLLAGALLYAGGETVPGLAAFGLAGLAWLAILLRRRS